MPTACGSGQEPHAVRGSLYSGTVAKVESEDRALPARDSLHAVPLAAGRTAADRERAVIPIPRLPGVKENGFYEAAWKYYQAHPNGPYIYGGRDPIPPNTETRPAHARWLKQYLPLVEDGTWAYLEIADSDLFAGPLPKDCVASVFANRDLYLVLANYGQSPQQIDTADAYVPTDDPAAAPAKQWQLPQRAADPALLRVNTAQNASRSGTGWSEATILRYHQAELP